jgi:glutamate-1-semialdehyde 2,1-aminomutase
MGEFKYQKSTNFLNRAELSIPLGSQTFSKSKTQYPVGSSPLFISRAKGPYAWDIDGNRYLDLVNSLAAITIGHSNKKITSAVRRQLKKGTLFTLPGILETEVAELIISTVPSAEMVRFAKNGTDATSAAIRLARSFTGRDEIAFCGYHGWHDWYIGATSMSKGVPRQVSDLTHKFIYNDIDSLETIFKHRPDKIGAVILEPMSSEYPRNNFLENVKAVTAKYGAILIFDETITGFRLSTGGAQQVFNVIPDLTTLGKGIANGYPLSVVTGRKEIMLEMEKIFFSGTFGGELLSLAAAKTVINLHIKHDVTYRLSQIGTEIASGLEKMILEYKLDQVLNLSGHPAWKFLNWNSINQFDSKTIKSFFMQEMLNKGVLVLSSHNVSLSLKERHIKKLLEIYSEVLFDISKSIADETLARRLKNKPLEPLFKIR